MENEKLFINIENGRIKSLGGNCLVKNWKEQFKKLKESFSLEHKDKEFEEKFLSEGSSSKESSFGSNDV